MTTLRGPLRLLTPLLAMVSVLAAGLFTATPASAAVVKPVASARATCSSSLAVVVLALQPENRVKRFLPAGPPRTGVSTSVSPNSVRVFDLFLRFPTSSVTVYVNGDPVNLVDPSGHAACAGDSADSCMTPGRNGTYTTTQISAAANAAKAEPTPQPCNIVCQLAATAPAVAHGGQTAYTVQPGLPAAPTGNLDAARYYQVALDDALFCAQNPQNEACPHEDWQRMLEILAGSYLAVVGVAAAGTGVMALAAPEAVAAGAGATAISAGPLADDVATLSSDASTLAVVEGALPKIADLVSRYGADITDKVLADGTRFVDTANGYNINVFLQRPDAEGFIRVTLDPSGERIISAGLNTLGNVVNGIGNGRFVPYVPAGQ